MQDVKSNGKSTTSTKEEKAGIKITKIIKKVQIINFWMEFMEKLQSYTKLNIFWLIFWKFAFVSFTNSSF